MKDEKIQVKTIQSEDEVDRLEIGGLRSGSGSDMGSGSGDFQCLNSFFDMSRKLVLLSAFVAFFIIPLSAQKAKVKLIYKPTLHNLTYSKENMRQLQLTKEPYIFYLGYEATDFQDAFINWRKNTFQVKARLYMPDINDSTQVKISLTLSNMTRESLRWLCFIDFNEHVITLKDRKGKGEIHGLPIHCSPPLTPNGVELFLDAKVRVDLRDEDKCTVEYTIREEKVEKIRSDEDFKSRVWRVYKDEDGNINKIYWDGLNVGSSAK